MSLWLLTHLTDSEHKPFVSDSTQDPSTIHYFPYTVCMFNIKVFSLFFFEEIFMETVFGDIDTTYFPHIVHKGVNISSR